MPDSKNGYEFSLQIAKYFQYLEHINSGKQVIGVCLLDSDTFKNQFYMYPNEDCKENTEKTFELAKHCVFNQGQVYLNKVLDL